MLTTSPPSWSTPSWRIEPTFSTRVLIGNWGEERRKFAKASKSSFESTFQKDFVWYPEHKADCITKWYSMRRREGLPYKNLITHHNEPQHRHLISTYEDHFNRHGYNPALPPIRTWNGQKQMWLPEKSDFPLLAPPTNYGLFESLLKKWEKPTRSELMNSVYNLSYVKHPVSKRKLFQRKHSNPMLPRLQ